MRKRCKLLLSALALTLASTCAGAAPTERDNDRPATPPFAADPGDESRACFRSIDFVLKEAINSRFQDRETLDTAHRRIEEKQSTMPTPPQVAAMTRNIVSHVYSPDFSALYHPDSAQQVTQEIAALMTVQFCQGRAR
ncbi:hypothetical protein [Cupriavidus malaysiensis]|uniref:Lipoprotein n=1 Tax=Cupriavidus malaysiensis TaxID=367825 RepID=A0A1D9ID13_9BURK|nr:hypothetical protein [Cupriavidus malaysiensis]AOZ10034.1 hypothetical protein BKK80_30710 [Cupriavidus malaysiensis]